MSSRTRSPPPVRDLPAALRAQEYPSWVSKCALRARRGDRDRRLKLQSLTNVSRPHLCVETDLVCVRRYDRPKRRNDTRRSQTAGLGRLAKCSHQTCPKKPGRSPCDGINYLSFATRLRGHAVTAVRSNMGRWTKSLRIAALRKKSGRADAPQEPQRPPLRPGFSKIISELKIM